MRIDVAIVSILLLLMSFQTPIEISGWNSDGPTFPLEVSTDKYYYVLGENVSITLSNIGDETITFLNPPHLYVVDSIGQVVVNTQWCAELEVVVYIPPGSNYSTGWNQKYLICDYSGNLVPPSGEQVPPGRYNISAGRDLAWYGNETIPIWDSVWIEIGSAEPDQPPVADAGPDQTVNEGDVVQFNGTGSRGSSVGLWEDPFEDNSKISQMVNTTMLGEAIVLTNVSLSIMHTFDTDPGFVIEDDMPNTVLWWDAGRKAIRWYVDREDPFDHYEKLVGFLPFPITDAMDISARVDYMYWRADTYAIADPLFLQKNESWRLGHKHGPTNNTLLIRVYGGDPVYGDLDRLVSWMYDDSDTIHIAYVTYYDKHYWELFTTRITWDSETRTMYGEVRDPLDNIVVNGSKFIDEEFTFSKYGVGSYGEGEIDGNPHIGEGFANNISISAFGYRTPGWVTSEVISPLGNLQSWGTLNVSASEPERTEIEIQVLDEVGSPIVTGIRPNDCPLSLDGLVDPSLYPRIILKAILSTDKNETPSLLSWNVSYYLERALSYYWDMNHLIDSDGDGNYTNDVDATGTTPTYVYYDDGIYIVTLEVTDASGMSDWDTCNITVLNVPPTPEWTSRSLDGTILNPPYPEGREILFEATVYDAGIYDTFTYDWDFGDGTVLFDAGPSVTHAYGDNDTYIVVLTVTDDDGGVGIDDTPPLLTTNENPIPSISLPFCIFLEGTTPCEAIGEFTDPGWLDTHSGVWDYGDGTYETAVITEENNPPDATGMNITSHFYGDNGDYDLTFTVVDDDGGAGTAYAEVHVENLPPSFTLDLPASVDEGRNFILGIIATDPGSDDIIIYIDWGDGTSETETYYNNGIGPDPPNSGQGVWPFTIYANFTHVYGDNGNFTVEVTVEDDDGGYVHDSATMEVINLPPYLVLPRCPCYAAEGQTGGLLSFGAHDEGSDDLEITWILELGPTRTVIHYNDGIGPDPPMSPWGTFPFGVSETVNHTYGDNGLYNLTIIVKDDDGGVTEAYRIINVSNLEPTLDLGGPYVGNENSPIDFTATASDPGSDDLTFIWDWGDGTTDAIVFYNDGMSPDPPKSPWGTYPFNVTHSISHTWGDNGKFTITLTVMDDDGGMTTSQTVIVVDNVNPTILNVSYEVFYNVPRTQGYWNFQCTEKLPSPDHVGIQQEFIDYISSYSRVFSGISTKDEVCDYLGTLDNSNMTQKAMQQLITLWLNVASNKLNLSSEMFIPQLNMTMNLLGLIIWIEDTILNDEDNMETAKDLADEINNGNLIPYAVLTFWGTASDPGSDDLIFAWNWGDGTSTEHIYYNDGVGPDPYPSPDVNPITVVDTAMHSCSSAGAYTITLTVTDDDGGSATISIAVTI